MAGKIYLRYKAQNSCEGIAITLLMYHYLSTCEIWWEVVLLKAAACVVAFLSRPVKCGRRPGIEFPCVLCFARIVDWGVEIMVYQRGQCIQTSLTLAPTFNFTYQHGLCLENSFVMISSLTFARDGSFLLCFYGCVSMYGTGYQLRISVTLIYIWKVNLCF